LAKFKEGGFIDPYLDQNSGCLRNLLNINDQKKLDNLEASLVTIRSWELERISFDKTFDLHHLKAIHKHLFQGIYEWAGQVREVNLAKGETHFLPHSLIEQGAKSTFTKLKQENCLKGLDPNDFSKEAGYYLGEINHIHPFREGNGRTQREFTNHLAHHNGYHIGWKNMTQKQMIEASIEADKGNPKPLAALIRENLVDRDLALSIRQERSLDGRDTRIFPAETGKKYDGAIIGVTERQVMQALINSPGHVIIHDRRSLTRIPDMNKRVEISYPHGTIGLVCEPEILKEKNPFKSHNLEKNSYQHEDREWER